MPFENNNGGSKRANKSENVNAISVFHDVNLALYTVTKFTPRQDWDCTKVINVFLSENLILFTVASIHRIRKSTKKETSEQGGR